MLFAPALRTRAVDRSFERFLNEAFFRPAARGAKVDQTDDAWTLSLDVPGVSREQLAIDVDGTVLSVKSVEGAARQYQAAYEFPADIDTDTTSAKLEHGVLTLTVGKKKPVVTARQIEVQ
jgi:HSP20 family molecular chaperone IbpA